MSRQAGIVAAVAVVGGIVLVAWSLASSQAKRAQVRQNSELERSIEGPRLPDPAADSRRFAQELEAEERASRARARTSAEEREAYYAKKAAQDLGPVDASEDLEWLSGLVRQSRDLAYAIEELRKISADERVSAAQRQEAARQAELAATKIAEKAAAED